MRLLIGKNLSSEVVKQLYDRGIRWAQSIDLSVSTPRIYREEFSIVWMYGDEACAKFGFSKANFFQAYTIDDPPCDHSTGYVRLSDRRPSRQDREKIKELIERFP